MYHSLSVMLFNTSEIERNIFVMADDVYRTIEIFKQAAEFEEKFARPFEMLSMIFDCLVFMAVALMIVGLVLEKRFVKLWQLARLSRLREKMQYKVSALQGTYKINNNNNNNKRKDTLPETRSSSVTSLPEINQEPGDDAISNTRIETSDHEEEDIMEKKMVGTAPWAKNWRVSTKIHNFGTWLSAR